MRTGLRARAVGVAAAACCVAGGVVAGAPASGTALSPARAAAAQTVTAHTVAAAGPAAGAVAPRTAAADTAAAETVAAGPAAAPVYVVYHPVTPVRVLDTRNGTGGFGSPVGWGQKIAVQVTGIDGVPASGVTAVVLNVTAVDPTVKGFVVVYPDGSARPDASNLNFTAGEVIPNLVVVAVGSDGKVDFYNSRGRVNLVADLSGYYIATGGSVFHAMAPVRVLDTRNGTGGVSSPVGPGQKIPVPVTGVDGVPASGVTAVVLNVTAVDPTAQGFVVVYPYGSARPDASNLNFTAGEVFPNLVVVAVGSDGKVDLYNSRGSVNLVADLSGYYTAADGGSVFDAMAPVRVLDTRNGTGGFSSPVEQGQTISVQVTGTHGVPASKVTAVVLNVTAVDPTAKGFVVVYPDGSARPDASNLNFTAGEVFPNLVVAAVGSDGKVDFYNSRGSVNLVADLSGYLVPTGNYPPNQPASPDTSPLPGCDTSSTNPPVIGNDDVTLSALISDNDGDNNLITQFILYNADGTTAWNSASQSQDVIVGDNTRAYETALTRPVIQGLHSDGATAAYTYYWQAQTTDLSGLTGAWSTKCWFTYDPVAPT